MKIKTTKPGTRVGTKNLQFVRRMKVELLGAAKNQEWNFVFPESYGVKERPVVMRLSKQNIITFSYGTALQNVLIERVHKANYEYERFCRHLRNLLAPPDENTIARWALSVQNLTMHYDDITALPSAQRTHAAIFNLEESQRQSLDPIINRSAKPTDLFHIPLSSPTLTYPIDDLHMSGREYRVGFLVNWWLHLSETRLTKEDRARLVIATDKVAYQIYQGTFELRNYLSKHAATTPHNETESVKNIIVRTSKRTGDSAPKLTEIFEVWCHSKTNRSKYSIRAWKSILNGFIKSVGHEDADRVTPDDVEAWKKKILESGTVEPDTFNNGHFNAIRAIFNLARKKEWIKKNPTDHLTRAESQEKTSARKAYFDREVVFILSRVMNNIDLPWKWITLIVGLTGARVGEVAMLHSSQVGPDEEFPNIWSIDLTKLVEHQTLKTKESRRKIPLHPKFIGSEFHKFVQSRKGKYLFADIDSDKDYVNSPFEAACGRSRRWITSILSEKLAKGPHHGFRHFVKSKALKMKLDYDVLQYVQGHERNYSTKTYRTPDQRECLDLIEAVFKDLDFTGSGASSTVK